MSHSYVFDAPNSYGLLFSSASSSLGSYFEGAPGVLVYAPEMYDQFFQYATKEACLEKALSVDPSFSKDVIYGPITIDVVDTSPTTVTGYVNQQVILFFECSSPNPGVTLSYQWSDPAGNLIPTATSSTFSFTPTSIAFSGFYTCVCRASGQYNWTGDTSTAIKVKLAEPLSF